MIVGRTGSGKTVAWRTLTRALAALKESHASDERYQRVHPYIINPLALSNDEIYGFVIENNAYASVSVGCKTCVLDS
jgi:dynein heavy chain, axonemal